MLAQWFKGIRLPRSLSPADGVTEPGSILVWIPVEMKMGAARTYINTSIDFHLSDIR